MFFFFLPGLREFPSEGPARVSLLSPFIALEKKNNQFNDEMTLSLVIYALDLVFANRSFSNLVAFLKVV
jgi:hypothetical protein